MENVIYYDKLHSELVIKMVEGVLPPKHDKWLNKLTEWKIVEVENSSEYFK